MAPKSKSSSAPSLPKASYGGRVQRGRIRVVKDGLPEVLGRNFLVPLRIQIDYGGANSVRATPLEEPLKDYPNLLPKDLGTLPVFQHHVKLQPGTQPYASTRARTMPRTRREVVINQKSCMPSPREDSEPSRRGTRCRKPSGRGEQDKPSGRGTQGRKPAGQGTSSSKPSERGTQSPQDEAPKALRTRHPKTSGRGTRSPLRTRH